MIGILAYSSVMQRDQSGAPARYHRQALLREVGETGQQRLAQSSALVVGCGALGTVSAELLVRAGIGTVTVVDRDIVEITNLQRQTLFDDTDAREGLPKAEAAHRRLSAVNPDVRVRGVIADFSYRNAEEILIESGLETRSTEARSTVIVDGTDNFETRYLLNDLAVKRGVGYVYGAAVGTIGMTMTIVPGRTACLRCAFEEPPEPGSAAASATCETIGVFAPVTAAIGAMQAGEAIKVLLGRFDAINRALLSIDAWTNEVRRVDLSRAKRDECPCCGRGEFPFLNGSRGQSSVVLCGRESVQIAPDRRGRIDLEDLARRLSPHGRFEATRFLVRGEFERERGEGGGPIRLTVFADGRAIVGGTWRVEQARAIHARYVGG